jgi:hypothetical protein
MIGLQIAGKRDRIPAQLFINSLNDFYGLIKDVDSIVSRRAKGSVRWELFTLQKKSPAVVEFAGESRIRAMDFSTAIQDSILDGLEQLAERPEHPQFYSYSALRRVRHMAEVSKHAQWMTVYANGRRALLDTRLFGNIEFLISSGTKSLGSVRGSLDAIIVHSRHEFRIWSHHTKQPLPVGLGRICLML